MENKDIQMNSMMEIKSFLNITFTFIGTFEFFEIRRTQTKVWGHTDNLVLKTLTFIYQIITKLI